MHSFETSLLLFAISAPIALAHGHVREVVANGVKYPGYVPFGNNDPARYVSWAFTTKGEGPVSMSNLNKPDIICHEGATNAKASISVSAGDTLQLRHFNGIGGFEHPGPVINYLAPCGSSGCGSVDKTTLKFFKFSESGLVQGGPSDSPRWEMQRWATTEVHKHVEKVDGGFIDTFAVQIPKDIKAGPYVLRHELWGLHKADKGEAEAYPQCINLNISSSGTATPSGISAMETYHANDPGIAIDIWKNLRSYIIPGPSIYASSRLSDY